MLARAIFASFLHLLSLSASSYSSSRFACSFSLLSSFHRSLALVISRTLALHLCLACPQVPARSSSSLAGFCSVTPHHSRQCHDDQREPIEILCYTPLYCTGTVVQCLQRRIALGASPSDATVLGGQKSSLCAHAIRHHLSLFCSGSYAICALRPAAWIVFSHEVQTATTASRCDWNAGALPGVRTLTSLPISSSWMRLEHVSTSQTALPHKRQQGNLPMKLFFAWHNVHSAAGCHGTTLCSNAAVDCPPLRSMEHGEWRMEEAESKETELLELKSMWSVTKEQEG